MTDNNSAKDIRICERVGCDNRITRKLRSKYCSKICYVIANREQALRRSRELRELMSDTTVSVTPGPAKPLGRLRKGSRNAKQRRRSSCKSNGRRHQQEVRSIRGMQQVPAERWYEYQFRR